MEIEIIDDEGFLEKLERKELYKTNKNEIALFGREKELKKIENLDKYEVGVGVAIGIHGLRRSGKTIIVQQYIGEKLKEEKNVGFFFTGDNSKNNKLNLNETIKKLEIFFSGFRKEKNVHFKTLEEYLKYTTKYKEGNDWGDFFLYLNYVIEEIKRKTKNKRIYIFFDEISWFSKSKNNNFLNAFSYFWNSYGSTCSGLTIFLATSNNAWYEAKIKNNTGGLFKRLYDLEIKPFSFNEIYRYFLLNKWNNNKLEVLKYYLIFGGFLKYYKEFSNILDFSLSLSDNANVLNDNYEYFIKEYNDLFNGVFSERKLYKEIMGVVCLKRSVDTNGIIQYLQNVNKNVNMNINKNNNYIKSQILDLSKSGFIIQRKFETYNYYSNSIPLIDFYEYWIKPQREFKVSEDYYFYQGKMFENYIFEHLKEILPLIEGQQGYLRNYNSILNLIITIRNTTQNNKKEKIQCDVVLSKRKKSNNKKSKKELILIEIKLYKDDGVISIEEKKALNRRKEILNKMFLNFDNHGNILNNVMLKTILITTNNKNNNIENVDKVINILDVEDI